MVNLILRLLGHRIVHRAVEKQMRDGGRLDVRFGLALLRDRRIPIFSKLLSLILGAGGVALLIALQLPLQALVALFIPILGLPFDIALNGLEATLGTLILSGLFLPALAPKPLVARLRAERRRTEAVVVPMVPDLPAHVAPRTLAR